MTSGNASGSLRRAEFDRPPVKLIDYEACLSREDARRGGRFLKTGKGKRSLRNRLGGFLSSLRENKLERH